MKKVLVLVAIFTSVAAISLNAQDVKKEQVKEEAKTEKCEQKKECSKEKKACCEDKKDATKNPTEAKAQKEVKEEDKKKD